MLHRNLINYLLHRFVTGYGNKTERVIAGSPRAYGIDLSHWEESFDPDAAQAGLIDFAIFKATEGTSWVDPSFSDFYASAAGKVPILGAYHYLRSGMSGRTQADHFLQAVGSKPCNIMVCDFESTNNIMDDAFVEVAQEFGKYIKTWRPDAKLLFYTNPSTYDNIVYPGSMRLYGLDAFTQSPWDGFWVAQYYFTPDPNKTPRLPYNRTDWVLWQYSEAGNPAIHGTGGWCDQNVFNGNPDQLHVWIGSDAPLPSPEDTIDYPYTGVKRTTGVRFGCPFQALEIQPDAIAGTGFAFPGNCATVEEISGDIVTNATGFSYQDCAPNQLLKINGSMIHPQADTEPYFYWDESNALHFDHRSSGIDALPDVAAVKRYLIMDGGRNPNPSPAWDEIHPWQLLGAGPNGETISILVQSPGFNLYRASELMLEFGVVWGGDLDSGGSGQTKIAGEVVRCTSEIRAVSNFLFIEIDNLPPGGTMSYKVKLPTTLRRFREPDIIKGDYGTLPIGMTLDSNLIFDNTWLILDYSPLPANDNKPPYAVALADLEEVTTTPPPPTGVKPVRSVVDMDDGSQWEATNFTQIT